MNFSIFRKIGPKAARFFAGAGAAAFLTLIAAGAHHYSTLLESLTENPLVSEWKGPAVLRVGESPACDGVPCWALPVVPNDHPSSGTGDFWRQADVPHANLAEQFRAAHAKDRVYYRFEIKIPSALAASGEEIAFSPNWVVHRRYDIYVDGIWSGSGHGSTPTGDIIYQKVVLPLPHAVAAKGRGLVVIAADVTPSDLGIQHLGKILVGPTTALSRLHVEAEYAMGSYYLLFLAAEGAIFVFFALIYLLATTRPGFGTFVVYAFLMASIHLAIGNFLEGLVPFGPRVWLYFLAKGGAATALAIYLIHVFAPKRTLPWLWHGAASLPLTVTLFLLVMKASGAAWATIPVLHTATGYSLFAVVVAFALTASFRAARNPGARGAGPAIAATLYTAFLTWALFVYKSQDFDYRPLADLGFFYYVAWLTIAEFGVAQARAGILSNNWRRLYNLFGRLAGKQLAEHLTITGSATVRQKRELTLMLIDVRFTNRLLRMHGEDKVLAALDSWLEIVADTAAKHCGEIHKIMGDKALVAWDLTGGDAMGAANAAAFAVSLREKSGVWNAERAAQQLFAVTWTSAIVTGRAIVGRVGTQSGTSRADYTVFGNLVSRAFTQTAAGKRAGVDVTADGRTILAAGGKLIFEPLAGQASTLIGLVENGVARIGLPRWANEFGGMTGGGRVFGAGSNQDIFVPDLGTDDMQEDAA